MVFFIFGDENVEILVINEFSSLYNILLKNVLIKKYMKNGISEIENFDKFFLFF